MLKTNKKCINCLNVFVSKAGQCEVCGAPEFLVIDEADMLPMQFLNNALRKMSLSDLIRLSKLGEIRIQFSTQQVSEEELNELLDYFKFPVERYTEIAIDLASGVQKPQTVIGIASHGDSENLNKLNQLRNIIFEPIRNSVKNVEEVVKTVSAELDLLNTYIIFKNAVDQQMQTLSQEACFEYILSSDYRAKIQNHLENSHREIQKKVGENDDRALLKAISIFAYYVEVRELAITILYLTYGDSLTDYKNLILRLKFANSNANPNGYLITVSDMFFIEMLLQNINWKSFRQDFRYDNPTPVRSNLHIESLSKTLQDLKNRFAELLPWQVLLTLELGGVAEPEKEELYNAFKENNLDFKLTSLFVERPFASESIKKIIQENRQYKDVGWTVGLNFNKIELPNIAKANLDTHEIEVLNEAVRLALKKIRKDAKPIVSDESLAHLQRHAVTNLIGMPSWQIEKLDKYFYDDLINLLVFHETDHNVVCQAVELHGSFPDLFWLRNEITLDYNLFSSLTKPQFEAHSKNYKMNSFLDFRNDVTKNADFKLSVENTFLENLYKWNLENNKDNYNFRNIFYLIDFILDHTKNHLNIEPLNDCFSMLIRFKNDLLKNSNDSLLEKMIRIDEQRRILSASLPLGQVLADSLKPYISGLQEFLKYQVHYEYNKAEVDKLTYFLKEQDVLFILRKNMSPADYCNFIFELFYTPNLTDYKLFDFLFSTIENIIVTDPKTEWLNNVRHRIKSVRYASNSAIDELLSNFLEKLNKPESSNSIVEPVLSEVSKTIEVVQESKQVDLNEIRAQVYKDLLEKLMQLFKDENIKLGENFKQKSTELSLKLGRDLSTPEGVAKSIDIQKEFHNHILTLQAEYKTNLEKLNANLEFAKKLLTMDS